MKCVSTRRRPMTSPPGGGKTTPPFRPSIGPASSTEARICLAKSGSRSQSRISSACTRQVWGLRSSIFTPIVSSSCLITCTSPICGTLCKTTGSSVRRHAASSGSAAFLLPEGVTSPLSGYPPSMRNAGMFHPFNFKIISSPGVRLSVFAASPLLIAISSKLELPI